MADLGNHSVRQDIRHIFCAGAGIFQKAINFRGSAQKVVETVSPNNHECRYLL